MSVAAAATLTAATAALTSSRPRFVVWFRSDLRMHDNPVLHKIAALPGAKEIVPVYCFDPRHFAKDAPHSFGCAKTGVLRAKFMCESVADLRSSLRACGSDLLVAVGKPEELLPTLVQPASAGPTTFVTQQQLTSEELRVDRAVVSALKKAHGSASAPALRTIFSGTLYDDENVKTMFGDDYSSMPDVFTPFRTKVEAKLEPPPPLASPKPGSLPLPANAGAVATAAAAAVGGAGFDSMPSLCALGFSSEEVTSAATPDPRGAMPFPGGERAALARLQHYIWDADCLGTYFETRNDMLGADYSSKFAPWLAHGCLSPRLVAAECAKYEKQRVKNKSTYWLVFELLWRDFFRFYAAKHGDAIFHVEGPARVRSKWISNPELLQRWKEGRLGVPLVDANMRELAATGFMSNRGRQNVASYLALDLALDWRTGASWFEETLLDYDVASNWGNWASAAGVTGGRVNRFNIVKQSKDYDADGAYVRHWLPELREVPAAKIHEPWTLSRDEQQRYGVTIGVDYPNPPKSNWAGFAGDESGGSGKGSGKGGGKAGGGGRGGGRGSGYVPSTPATAAVVAGGREGGRGRGGKGGGARKRVQHDYLE